MINSCDIGGRYKFVNNKLSSDKDIPPLKSPDGSLISGSVEKANTFNEDFSSVFERYNKKLPPALRKLTIVTCYLMLSSALKRLIKH